MIQLPLVKNTSGSVPFLAVPAEAMAGAVVEAVDLLPVPSPSSVKPYEVAIDAVGERVEQ